MKFLAKNDDQSIEDWIEQLEIDCMYLHLKCKDLPSFDDEIRGDYFDWFLECSEEPQYKLMRELAWLLRLKPEAKADSLIKIQLYCQECMSYVKTLEQESEKDKYFRIYSEMLYAEGKTVIESVDSLIKAELVDVIDRDNAEKRVSNFRRKLPRFKGTDTTPLIPTTSKIDIEKYQRDLDPKKLS